MRVVAERSIGGLLAVAELVVAALVDIEDDRPQAHHIEVALVVTEGLSPGGPTGAPAVQFASLQVGIEGDKAAAVRK